MHAIETRVADPDLDPVILGHPDPVKIPVIFFIYRHKILTKIQVP